MKLGLKLWSTNTDNYLKEAARLFKDGWFDYVELYIVPGTAENILKWKTLDIPFTLHAPHFMNGVCFSDSNKEKINLEIFKEVEEFFTALNAKYVVVHPGIEGCIDESVRQLKNLSEKHSDFTKNILIENKPYVAPLANKKICRGATVEEIKKIIAATNFGFCLDVGHAICSANSQKKDPYEYLYEFQKLNPNAYHLSGNFIDNEMDEHFHLRKANYDFKKIFDIIDLNKNIVIETNKDNSENLDDFTDDIFYLRGLIN